MLSSTYPKLMIFQFPRLCWWTGARMAGREQAKDNCPELAKGIFCTTERIVQCINWGGGGVARNCQMLLRHWLGIGQWVVSSCIVHHLYFLDFIPLSLFVVFFFITIISSSSSSSILYFISIVKLFLSQPIGFTFLPFSSWLHQGREGR